jgi:hypothetical protein
MLLRRQLLLASCLVLSACQGLGGGEKDAVPPPQASVTGSHVDDGNGRIDTFRVTEIDGHPVGRVEEPSKTIGIDAAYRIDATRKVHLEFEGLARYANPMKTLFWDPHSVQGSVDFVPAAAGRYVVRGEIGPEGSSVWLEDDASHEVIGRKFMAAPKPTPPVPERNL